MGYLRCLYCRPDGKYILIVVGLGFAQSVEFNSENQGLILLNKINNSKACYDIHNILAEWVIRPLDVVRRRDRMRVAKGNGDYAAG